MVRPIELIPLVCVQCSTRLPAQPDEVAWVCPQCGQAQLLDDDDGLTPLTIRYAAGITPGSKGNPFWVAKGQASLRRETYSGNKDRDAQVFWSQPRWFFVPAFNCSLETLVGTGARLLLQPPQLQPGPAAAFEPVTLPLADVTATAEFIVMAIEADRKDKVKQIQLKLALEPPALWILPRM